MLNIRDGKSRYDVTMPATAFASFNVLSYRRNPDEVLDRIDRLCADAAFACLAKLKQRRHCQHGSAAIDLVETIPLHRYEALLDCLDAVTRSRLGTLGASLAADDFPPPVHAQPGILIPLAHGREPSAFRTALTSTQKRARLQHLVGDSHEPISLCNC